MRDPERQPHILAHTGPRHQRRFLEHEADRMRRLRLAVAMRDADLPGARRVEAGDQPQHVEVERPERRDGVVIDFCHAAQAHREASCVHLG